MINKFLNSFILAAIGFVASNAIVNNSFANTDCSNEGSFPTVSKEELQNIVKAKSAFIVDVNGDESYKKVHVPGAIHYKTNEKNFAKMLPADKKALIVSYCGGPACTAWLKAAETACKLGYTNIRHFKDGIQGWAAAKN